MLNDTRLISFGFLVEKIAKAASRVVIRFFADVLFRDSADLILRD